MRDLVRATLTPTGEAATRPLSTARAPLSGRPTRVALIGTGYIADTHLEALRLVPEVEVVALCDVSLERARAASLRHQVALAVATPDELADHAIDVVHLCVPPDLHAELARECLELGFSVFVEKPLALDSRTASELFELARKRALALGANHNACFHPAFARLLERVRAGEIGRIEHVGVHLAVPLRQLEARDFSHWMFRQPQNIVFEQAVQPFAQLVQLVGRPLELHPLVLATRPLGPDQPFHERWSIAARAERGTVQLHFAFGATFQQSTLAVRGSDGALEADLHRNLLGGERKTPWLDFWDAYLAGVGRGTSLRSDSRANLVQYLRQTLRLGPRGDAFFAGMLGSMRAFHAAYRAGTEPPGGADEVAAVLEWCEGCVRELASPRPAPAPAFDQRPARAGEVVVLGSSGFIGQHTLRALLARGHSVTAGMRRPRPLSEGLALAARAGELRLVRTDLAEPAALAAAIRGARTVLHLATGGGASWEEIERAMVGGTRAVAEACLAARVERLVYVSSIAALYLGPDCGASVVDDGDPPDPRPAERAPYARGKIAAEKELLRFAKERGLAVTIVRPGVVMGAEAPFQHSGIGLWVRDNHCVGWGLGERPLPLVLVEDVAEALSALASFPGHELDGRAVNLAARVPLTARELVAHFARVRGRDAHFHPRALSLSQTMEIGKWLVKRAGGRRDPFPSYRDLKSRSLWPEFSCRNARELLGWKPCEEREEFLRRLFPPQP
jgi:predicted dehydrogenase/nucleoside-diphosphate-sugar epimerase